MWTKEKDKRGKCMTNYRQWKKKYKKLHGYNPLVKDDRRKLAKATKSGRLLEVFFNEFLGYNIHTYKLVDDNSVNLPTITVTFSTYKSAEE